MSTSIRLSMDAPGSGQRGSVLCERATGRSHWKPLSMKVFVSDCRVWVMTLPMQAFLSSSVGDNWSRGLGRSASDMHGAVVSLTFILFHFWLLVS